MASDADAITEERLAECRAALTEWDSTEEWILKTRYADLLAAAARLKETEARCEALRTSFFETRYLRRGEVRCKQCGKTWFIGEIEHHVVGCIARPLPESQR